MHNLNDQKPVAWLYKSEDPFDSSQWLITYDKPNRREVKPLYLHPAPITEDDGAKYRLVRKLLSTNMFNYYLLEGKSEENIDEWVDEVLAAARSGE